MIHPSATAIPDDGIPVLTDVVDPAMLAPGAESGPDQQGDAPSASDAALSMAMFPELEPGANVELERELEPFGVEESLVADNAAQTPVDDSMPTGLPGLAVTFAAGEDAVMPSPVEAAQDNPSTLAEPAADPSVAAESRSEMETRIFEALAARLDRLIDERLDPVIEGSIEAAFAGVKAGLSASLNQAVREAVEQAVRDEFERRSDGSSPR